MSSNGKITRLVRKSSDWKFAESLPAGCPPDSAVNIGKQMLLRLVKANPPTAKDFVSRHAEGLPRPPGCDECTHKAVSYWVESAPPENITDLLKFPRFKKSMKFIAKISVSESSGKTMPDDPNGKGHIRLWRFQSFAPEQHVESMEEL